MTILLAWVLAIGLFICQDAICSILYYVGKESWHYSQMCRLFRLVAGIALILLATMMLK